MDYTELIQALHDEASEIGVFLPLLVDTSVLDTETELHECRLPNRAVFQMRPVYDADEHGAPTAETIARYCDAVRHSCYSMVWLEPAAVTPDARADAHQLVLCEENQDAFIALCAALHDAAVEAHGTAPIVVALIDHAGRRALRPVTTTHSPTLPTVAALLEDSSITQIVVNCGIAAKVAAGAGFSGVALNACDRNLFGESLAAYHREGRFGGDFDNRTRFVRDCYTAMKLTADEMFLTIRLSLSDGLPQPNGWGMSVSASGALDLSEPALLLRVLRKLYGVKLVACDIGIPHINWMASAKEETELIRTSRLCTAIAMLDSAMQEHVQLILPEKPWEDIPFDNLAAGMIDGEFASFAGFAG